ncbi:MAG: STAS domain-containing protein [Saprospiraceae bacterium]|jgi:anti-sigma B factor antagonist|nr:STAS domain-containing protein [Saprospiraceae bacterium]
MQKDFTIVERPGVLIVHVHHLLSETINKEILSAVQSGIDQGFTTFVVDLTDAPFINSVGLNVLIHLMLRSKEAGGNMAIANVSAKVLQLLEVTKLKSMFLIAPDLEAAMQLLLAEE